MAETTATGEQVTGGPKVFLDYDQDALDRAYDQMAYAPNREQVGQRERAGSDEARRRLGEPKRVAYGPSEYERLDIYATKRTPAPIVVYVHGGAWRSGGASDVAQPAEMFVAAGAHYVVLDFVLVTQTPDSSLLPMAEQIRRAFAWVYENADSFGGDRERIHLAGHSSGGHLGGCMMVTDWQKEFGLPANLIKSAVLSSGMYDLLGPSLSARSRYVSFTPEMIEALSPQRHLDLLNAPLTLLYGTLETPEFQRQTREFYEAVRRAGKPAELVVGEGYNHFEMRETLGNPFGPMGRAALSLFGLELGK